MTGESSSGLVARPAASSARGSASRGFTLAELIVVVALTTIVLLSILPVADTLVRHQGLATDYTEDLAQGTRVADRIGREIRASHERVVFLPWSGKRPRTDELFLWSGAAGVVRVGVSSGRAVLERLDAQGRLLGRTDLGRVGALAFEAAPAKGSRLVSFDVELTRRTPGARPAVLSSAALVESESAP